MSQILTISNDLRTIDIPRDFVLGVESDDDVNRVYFSLPAMYGDTALWPYKIRINYMNANGEGDMYTVPDEDKEIEANGVVDSIAIADAVEEVIEFTDTRYASSYDQDTVHLYYHEPDELDTQSNSIWFDISSDTIYMYRTAYGDQQWHNIEEKYVYDTTTGEWTGYPAVEASRLKTILRLLANNWSSNENSTISYSENMFLFVAKTEAAANSFLAQTGSAPYFLFAEYSKNNTLVTKLYQYVPKADGTAREWIEITDESTFGVPKNESGVPIYGDNYHIRFSWLVGRHACEIKGKVRFIVCLKLTDDQGVITNEFNTAVHEVPVLEGLETSEAIVQEREDIIEAILLRMDKIESIDIEGGYDKVIEVLDSIPEDYSELSQDVSDLKDDLSDMQEEIDSFEGISDEVKVALLNCFTHVAWIDEHGQDYYDALEAALNDIQSISAVYTQSGTVYATDTLDSLKENLVVTATKPDSTQYVVPDSKYTLSGMLMVGVSTITVTYKSQTATFNVNVTDSRLVYEIPANTDLYNYKRYDTQQHQFTVEEDFTILISTSYKANPRISYGNAFLLDGADGDAQSPGIRIGLDVVNSAENFITNYMYSDYYASQTYPTNTERSVIWIVRNSNKQLRKVLYVDGSKIVDKSESLSSYTGKTYYDTYWIGGAHHLGSARPFDGIARLFRIYNTALDISEINAILGTELE